MYDGYCIYTETLFEICAHISCHKQNSLFELFCPIKAQFLLFSLKVLEVEVPVRTVMMQINKFRKETYKRETKEGKYQQHHV